MTSAISRQQSQKLKVLSFVCMVLVLYIHSQFRQTTSDVGSYPICCFLQQVISGQLALFAVPMFFSISGYLFFLGTEAGLPQVWAKILRRFNTLLVPYLLACLFQPLVFLLAEAIAPQMLVDSSFTQYLCEPWYKVLCRIFIVNPPTTAPFAYQLWFVRDLILVICCTPLLWWLRQHRWWLEALLPFLFVLLCCIPTLSPLSALLWFTFGVCCLDRLGQAGHWGWYLGAFVVMIVVRLLRPDLCDSFLLTPLFILLGLVGVWGLYDAIVPSGFDLSSHRWLKLACASTFFIYLYHIPLIAVVRRLLVLMLGGASWVYTMVYLVAPWLILLIMLPIAMLLSRYLPRFYSALVGGRVG